MIFQRSKIAQWMRQRLQALPLVAALLAVLVLFGTEKPLPGPLLEHSWLLPELRNKTSELEKIVLWSARGRLVLEKKGSLWVLPQLGNYPADLRQVVDFILLLRETRILAQKTAKPRYLPILGLDEQQGTHVMLVAGGHIVGDFISGRPSVHGQGGFVRYNGQSQAWLVNKPVIAPVSPLSWLDTTLLDIGPDRFSHLQVYAGNRLVRSWPQDQATGTQGAEYVPRDGAENITGALRPLAFIGVRARPLGPLQARFTTRIHTREGLIYQLDHYWYDQQWWTAIQASPADERLSLAETDAQWLRQIQRANARWQAWWYQLPDQALSALTLGQIEQTGRQDERQKKISL